MEVKQEESNPVYFHLSAFSLFRSSFVGTVVDLMTVVNKTTETPFFCSDGEQWLPYHRGSRSAVATYLSESLISEFRDWMDRI